MDTPTPSNPSRSSPRRRRGAVGKALLVWLFSGSAVLALIALLVFGGMGC